MHIVLDTTALRRDFPLDSPDMRLMRQYLHKTGSNLFIPKVALDELCNQHRELLEKTKSDLLTNIRQLLSWSNVKLPEIDVPAESQKYRQTLEQRLLSHYRARFIPYPEVSHESLVARDLGRLKPFSESGRGYRDSLIWYSVLSLLSSQAREFAFVTANLRDFWNPDRTGLHAELTADLTAKGIEPFRLRLFQGIDALNTAIVKPKLQMLDDVLRELQAGTHPALDIHSVMTDREGVLEAEIMKRNPNSLIRHALGYLFLSIEISSVSTEGPAPLNVTTVIEIESKKLFVEFVAGYDVLFTATVPVEDLVKWKDSGVMAFEPEVFGDNAEVQLDFRGDFTAALVFDPTARAVENFEITDFDLVPN